MYIPKHYQITEEKLIFEFLQSNSFAIIISNGEQTPSATHLPFIVKKEDEELKLVTHLAKENPHAKILEQNQDVLIIFNGPHGYISPLWYANPINVPTWNYASVHIHGKVECVHDASEKLQILKETIVFYEEKYLEQFNTLPKEYIDGMLEHITGVRVKVVAIEAKFKMNQNKTKEDLEGVMSNLLKNDPMNKPLVDLIVKMNQEKLK